MTRTASLILGLLLLLAGWRVSAREEVEVSVTAGCVDAAVLSVTLRNAGKKELSLPAQFAPWHGSGYFSIDVASLNGAQQVDLDRVDVIDDVVDEILLSAGSKTSGQIDLAAIFPDLGDLIGKQDVIVRWRQAPVPLPNGVILASEGSVRFGPKGCEPLEPNAPR